MYGARLFAIPVGRGRETRRDETRACERMVYLRAHQNGYLLVTGRNSFTYGGGFYDTFTRGEKEGEEREAKGELFPSCTSFRDLGERYPDVRSSTCRPIPISEILSMTGPVISSN